MRLRCFALLCFALVCVGDFELSQLSCLIRSVSRPTRLECMRRGFESLLRAAFSLEIVVSCLVLCCFVLLCLSFSLSLFLSIGYSCRHSAIINTSVTMQLHYMCLVVAHGSSLVCTSHLILRTRVGCVRTIFFDYACDVSGCLSHVTFWLGAINTA